MQRHENTVGVLGVVAKWPAVCEAGAFVEPVGGLKRFCGSSFKAQALVTSGSGNFDEMYKDGPPGPPAAQCLGRTHGLDLAMLAVEFFEGATAKQLRPLPRRPESDLGLAEFVLVQRVNTLRRRKLVHAFQMFVEQCVDLSARKVVDLDLQGHSDLFHTVSGRRNRLRLMQLQQKIDRLGFQFAQTFLCPPVPPRFLRNFP
jgi:hypothetical protein